MEERITMSHNELKRLEIIRKVVYEGMTQVKASEVLAVSDRQIRRLIKRYEQYGTKGLISRKTGRCGAKSFDLRVKKRIITLLKLKKSLFLSQYCVLIRQLNFVWRLSSGNNKDK